MIAECLEDGREFGIVWASDDGLKVNGCAMEVTEVLERHEDGRLDILTRGTRPFRILEEHFDHSYPAGEIEFLEDKEESPDPPTVDAAHEAYGSLVEEATDKVLEPEVLAPLTAYEMAATVDFGPDAKQGLLDLRSENARMRLLTRLFRAAVKRLDFIERAQARARSNGKVRFG
jgi:Lon protease-like protein